MRYKRFIAFMLSFFLLFLAGCSKKVDEQIQETRSLQGRIVLWADKESMKATKLSIDNFKKIHNKAEVVLEEVNKTELTTKLNNALSGKSEIPDMIISEDEDIQQLLKNYPNIFMDTGNLIKKEDYLKYKIDNLTRNGKLYGVPFTSKPAVLLYRKDLLLASGVNAEYIKTWGDLILAGKSVSQSQKLNILTLPLEEESSYRFFISQLGASYFDKDGNPTLNSDDIVRAIDMMKNLYIQGTIKNTDSLANGVDQLIKGKAAFALVSLEEVNSILNSNQSLKGKLGLIKIPAFEEGGNEGVDLGGDNLLVLNSTLYKSLVLEFTKFMAEDRNNIKTLLENTGTFPAFTSYYDEVWFSKKEPYFGDIKLWKIVSENAQDIYGINYTENVSVLMPILKDSFQTIVVKGADSKSTLEDLQKKFQIAK